MNRNFRPLLCILLIWSGSAVSQPLQIESRSMHWKTSPTAEASWQSQWAEGAVKMPYIKAADPLVAARINDMLYLSVASSPAPNRPGKTFPAPEGDGLIGTAALEFTIARNDNRILSISFDLEGCGAYCETYRQEFSFDARTGRLLALDDLLTPQGLVAAGQRIFKERERQYLAQIKTLNQELTVLTKQQQAGKNVDLSDTRERIELNENCLGNIKERRKELKASNAMRETAMATRFTLPANKGLTFTSERCSAHVNRALDDVYEVETPLSLEELSPWLTAYGKSLLLEEAQVAEPAKPFGQILHGKIGAAAVTLMLYRPYEDGSFSGIYYYDKYRKPIAISGKLTSNGIEIVEQIAENEQARITLVVSHNHLTGQWQHKDKKLPIKLSRK